MFQLDVTAVGLLTGEKKLNTNIEIKAPIAKKLSIKPKKPRSNREVLTSNNEFKPDGAVGSTKKAAVVLVESRFLLRNCASNDVVDQQKGGREAEGSLLCARYLGKADWQTQWRRAQTIHNSIEAGTGHLWSGGARTGEKLFEQSNSGNEM
ncbi:hypothetical protein B0A55_07752 [Friedmanniomyces simplex]|uniref:Uncharacterized protein n=1 Tax=Friedmanniomyces simplex TaxID=329884 RepID=A0A4U0XBG2_9PEZI|nr:hypothetical protein B0A55_07752 [Friedmanniomyces simplex]